VAAIMAMGHAPHAGPPTGQVLRRQWLHIGESPVEQRHDLATA
jgi:hypothetical protein